MLLLRLPTNVLSTNGDAKPFVHDSKPSPATRGVHRARLAREHYAGCTYLPGTQNGNAVEALGSTLSIACIVAENLHLFAQNHCG